MLARVPGPADTEDTEADGQADDEEADHHGVLGRALALLALEAGQHERNPLEHSLPPFQLAARRDPALLRLTSFSRVVRAAPHREGVGGATPSAQLHRRPADDNRGVADYVEVTRADGELVCRCRVATSFVLRVRGLMGAAQLPPGSGLLLPGTSSVHTHFMRFPIDVVFLDAEWRIVSVVAALRS